MEVIEVTVRGKEVSASVIGFTFSIGLDIKRRMTMVDREAGTF